MKKTFLSVSALLLMCSLYAQKPAPKPAPKPLPKTAVKPIVPVAPMKNAADSLSYAFGISLAEYMKSQGISKINFALLNKAIDQTLKGQATYFDPATANTVMSKISEEKGKKKLAMEKEIGEKFLADNKKKPGVFVTPTGLQYEILKKGDGLKPTIADTVSAHYAGSLIDGKEFDNSYKRGEPLTIPVSGVIAGWTEALQMMPVGSKWKLYIPSTSGYGDYGAGQDIPGGATLIFIVELVSIVNQK